MQPILVVGGDMRTHAIVLKLLMEGRKVICTPGNGGIFADPRVVRGKVKADDHAGLVELARATGALTIVGPEGPLVAGIGDKFAAAGLSFVGPFKDGASIEGSKAGCCELLMEAGVPIPRFKIFTDASDAIRYLGKAEFPLVIKADGLCSGKGVRIVKNFVEAAKAIEDFMVVKVFGEAGATIVIQEFLVGPELSMFAFVDSSGFALYTILSQDHKTVGNANTGPMTGGMGAIAPVPFAREELRQQIIKTIFEPTLATGARQGALFQGVLYAGLKVTSSGPCVLEFNCRPGDPETEVVLPLLKTPLGDILEAIPTGDLNRIGPLQWHDGSACIVVMAAENYPDKPVTGDVINGLNECGQLAVVPDHPGQIDDLHGGTECEDGVWKTAGGRVIGARCRAATHPLAVEGAYKGVHQVSWRGEKHREDIGAYAN